jgi:hypothetical protein
MDESDGFQVDEEGDSESTHQDEEGNPTFPGHRGYEEMATCAICGAYSVKGVEVHEICLDRLKSKTAPTQSVHGVPHRFQSDPDRWKGYPYCSFSLYGHGCDMFEEADIHIRWGE